MKVFTKIIMLTSILTILGCDGGSSSKSGPAANDNSDIKEMIQMYSQLGTPVTAKALLANPWCELLEEDNLGGSNSILLFKNTGIMISNEITISNGVHNVAVDKVPYKVSTGLIESAVDNKIVTAKAWTSNQIMDNGTVTLLITSEFDTVEYIACPDAHVQE